MTHSNLKGCGDTVEATSSHFYFLFSNKLLSHEFLLKWLRKTQSVTSTFHFLKGKPKLHNLENKTVPPTRWQTQKRNSIVSQDTFNNYCIDVVSFVCSSQLNSCGRIYECSRLTPPGQESGVCTRIWCVHKRVSASDSSKRENRQTLTKSTY